MMPDGDISNLTPLEREKWQRLQQLPVLDAQNPALIEVARNLYQVARLSPWPSWAFACLALSVSRDLIVYQRDLDRVGREQIDGITDPYTDPLLPLKRGYDDCDAKARMFVALNLAIGQRAELWPREKEKKLAHVYARVFVLGPQSQRAEWVFAETILRRARLGEAAEQVPKETSGQWLF
jgi:hypothetical protein